jgi:endonuclease III related protein
MALVAADPGERLRAILERLEEHWGDQHWWPGESPFEVMVGAVLTQNTAWVNVERAIGNLRTLDALDPVPLLALSPEELATALRPSGYFNVKAQRLRNAVAWWQDAGGHAALATRPTALLRQQLLAIKGIGPETADDILCYAFDRPVFVVDAYTRRILARLGLPHAADHYEVLRAWVEQVLGPDVRACNQLHALIVQLAKRHCRPRPVCDGCPLEAACPRIGVMGGA